MQLYVLDPDTYASGWCFVASDDSEAKEKAEAILLREEIPFTQGIPARKPRHEGARAVRAFECPHKLYYVLIQTDEFSFSYD